MKRIHFYSCWLFIIGLSLYNDVVLFGQKQIEPYFSVQSKSGVINFGWNNDAIRIQPSPIFAFQVGIGVIKPLSEKLSFFSEIDLGKETVGRNIKLKTDENIYSTERTILYYTVGQLGIIYDVNDKLNFRLSFQNYFLLPARYKSTLDESQSASNTIQLDRNYQGYYLPRIALMVGKWSGDFERYYFEAGIESNALSKDIAINRIIGGNITDRFTGKQYTALIVASMIHSF